MRLPVASACLFALFTLFHAMAAQAQLVTFKATGTVAQHVANAGELPTRFPIGTAIEVIYTFDLATPDEYLSDEVYGYYPTAIRTAIVRIGDYEQTFTTGIIEIFNDRSGGAQKGSQCDIGTYRPNPLLADVYSVWVETAEQPGVEPLPGYAPLGAGLEVHQDCGPSWTPADLLSTDALSVTPPPQPNAPAPSNGLYLAWRDGATSGESLIYGVLTSLTFVRSVPPPNTDTGSGVAVTPPVALPDGFMGSVSLTFANVESAGATTVTASSQGPPPPSGFKLTNPPVYYEISTTATFSGSVRVCLSWTEGQIANESQVQMFHYEGNQWVNITDPASRDTANNTVCGSTTSFSAFTLMEVKHPFSGFFQPVDNLPTVNAVKAGAAVPVKFSLGGDLGLDIFASTYPQSKLMQCETGEPISAVEETVNAGGSSLSYDATTGLYTYVWKTQKAWANSCRELQLVLNDGEVYTARFTLRK